MNKSKKMDIYPDTNKVAYIHTIKGTKIVPLSILFKNKFIKSLDIKFVDSKYLYYINGNNDNKIIEKIEIPSNLKLFIVLKNKKTFLFGIIDRNTPNESIGIFPQMPNQIDGFQEIPEFKAICYNNYIPHSAQDAVQKFILMPFSQKPNFLYKKINIEVFLKFLALEE